MNIIIVGEVVFVTEHKPLRLSEAVGMQVGLINREDTVEDTHYEAMSTRAMKITGCQRMD